MAYLYIKKFFGELQLWWGSAWLTMGGGAGAGAGGGSGLVLFLSEILFCFDVHSEGDDGGGICVLLGS